MLRIVLGFETTSRNETPVVVYCGHDGRESQEAIDDAPATIVRFERVEGVHGFPGRRSPAPELAPGAPRPLARHTVTELKALCDDAGIETTGLRLKADFINALEAQTKPE